MINYIRKKRIHSYVKNLKVDRERMFLNYDSIKNVLILFNIEDYDDVKSVVTALRGDQKRVMLWTVRSKDNRDCVASSDARVIDFEKEISWTGSISEQLLEEFDRLDYETLLDLTTHKELMLEYLLAVNTRKFSIGIRDNEFTTHDFIMAKGDNVSIFDTYSQMKHYLNNNFR